MIQKPKGTRDIIQTESYKWQHIENIVKNILKNYGYKEIRTPVFESTELFQRGVGDTTDVVQKEMYTFEDKGGRSITLRPEGTASVVRAYIENGMASMPSPVKLWYNMAMYRYENVQKGRLREFHQIGAEVFGSTSYQADVETIVMANDILSKLNIPNVELNINSIGCPKCRTEYQNALREFIRPNLDKYCDTCKSRFERNPMRILDCKEEKCKQLNHGAPVILDYLCEECREHFESVKGLLDTLGIKYNIDPEIVRGLDYYTKTVFEFISKNEGYTVLAGGRYDGLVKELDGQDTPALGFALGMERLIEIYEKYNTEVQNAKPQLFVAQIGEQANIYATKLVYKLRQNGIYVEKDITGKSINAQFKYANKIGAKYVITIGENELQTNTAELKNMETGETMQIELDVNEIIENILSDVIN
ncbi:MAG: histidine--tRNA ligase [Clostridia bacterium]|nr:histidine--tRNA ligase [Clostridia bacterium]